MECNDYQLTQQWLSFVNILLQSSSLKAYFPILVQLISDEFVFMYSLCYTNTGCSYAILQKYILWTYCSHEKDSTTMKMSMLWITCFCKQFTLKSRILRQGGAWQSKLPYTISLSPLCCSKSTKRLLASFETCLGNTFHLYIFAQSVSFGNTCSCFNFQMKIQVFFN